MKKKKQPGALEDEILSLFMGRDEGLSVGEVHSALKKKNAYTTIMTVMSRLWEKGTLKRTKVGRSYLYSLKTGFSPLQSLKKRFSKAPLTEIFNTFINEDVSDEELGEIEELIKERRRKR